MKFDLWWLYQRAKVFSLLRRPDMAVDDLQAALRIDPAFVRAAASLGFLYGTLGRHRLAIEQFQSVLKARPDDSVILFNLG